MATLARDNGRSVIVADEDLLLLLAGMLEKMDLVEAKLMQLRRQGPFSSTAGAEASSATSSVDSAKSAARKLSMKAVDVAKEAVLFCAGLDNTYCRLKPRRVLEH